MLQSKYSGLTTQEAQNLLQQYGENTLQTKAKRSVFKELYEEIKNPMTLILLFASGVSFALDEKIDALIIFAIIILNIGLSFFQKFKADKAVEKLQSLVNPHTKVFRENHLISIQSSQLVPGDTIKLSEGDLIPADGVILESKQFYVQESTLTGESVPLNKQTTDKLFMGTECVQGQAICRITETGINTEFGQIADLTANTRKDLSPLQKEIVSLSHTIAKVMIGVSILFFLISILRDGTDQILKTIIFTASIAVAAVPEGLPTTLTLSLSLAVERMAKKGSIIKSLSSVETLGSTDIIVTDKTGTLTKNQMTVTDIITIDENIKVNGTGYYVEPTGDLKFLKSGINIDHQTDLELLQKSPKTEKFLYRQSLVSLLCNDSIIDENNKLIGDPTEGALITLANKTPFNQNTIENYEIIDSIPFNSKDKFMACLAQDIKTKKKYILVKGAPEIVTQMCQLETKQTKKLQAETNQLAENALRTLALAIKETKAESLQPKYLKNLDFISITGIIDPPREETRNALIQANKLGIQVIMATGDHPLTAKAIGKQLGFNTKKVITGHDLETISDKDLNNLILSQENIIFARVKPKHKLRIVNSAKNIDKIVGVTGDGVNDAPALKRADIGIAMGITGTEVSKEAADMILTQDDFSDIVTAIKEGRIIYKNIRKFLFYMFSCNLGEIVCILIAFILGLPLPLTAILLLVINLGTDVFPAISLSFEEESDTRKEDSHKRSLLNKPTSIRILIQGIGLGIISFINFYLVYEKTQNYVLASSVCFLSLVVAQLINAYNAKSDVKSIFSIQTLKNSYLHISVIFSLALSLIIIYSPYLNSIFKTESIGTSNIILIASTSILVIILDELHKKAKNRAG